MKKKVIVVVLIPVLVIVAVAAALSFLFPVNPAVYWQNMNISRQKRGAVDCGIIYERTGFTPGTSEMSREETATVLDCFNRAMADCTPGYFLFKYTTWESYREETYFRTYNSSKNCEIRYDTVSRDMSFSKTSRGGCRELTLLDRISPEGYGYLDRTKCTITDD